MPLFLITGFSPFGGQERNPSWEAVSSLPQEIRGVCIKKALLPVSYLGAREQVLELLNLYRPDLLLSVGQAGGIGCIKIEKAALNVMSAKIPDNDGVLQTGEPIFPQGPAGYFSTLANPEIRAAVSSAGIPAEISYHAGTYVCNCVFYTGLHAAATCFPKLKAGFLHIPYMEGQKVPPSTCSFPLEQLQNSVKTAVEFLAAAF